MESNIVWRPEPIGHPSPDLGVLESSEAPACQTGAGPDCFKSPILMETGEIKTR